MSWPQGVGNRRSGRCPNWTSYVIRGDCSDDFKERLRQGLGLDVPSLIVLPIDYSIDVAISEELGTETVAT